MKIYTRKDFLELPNGTVYHEGEPWAFGDIQIKHETWKNDWLYQSFGWIEAQNSNEATDRLYEMQETGVSYPLDTSWSRNGLFEEESIFLVYEPDDIDTMIESLKKAKEQAAS